MRNTSPLDWKIEKFEHKSMKNTLQRRPRGAELPFEYKSMKNTSPLDWKIEKFEYKSMKNTLQRRPRGSNSHWKLMYWV